jgi:hypothetical protein
MDWRSKQVAEAHYGQPRLRAVLPPSRLRDGSSFGPTALGSQDICHLVASKDGLSQDLDSYPGVNRKCVRLEHAPSY